MDARAGTPARLFERSMGHGDAWEVADVWFEPHEGADELHVGVARRRGAAGRAWAVLRRAVAEARQAADHSGVARVGVDDTSRARHRTHISVMADLDARRVVAVTDGRARRGESMADRGCRPRRLARPAPPEVEARVADARTRLPRRRSRWPPRCPGLRTARLTCGRRPGGRPRPSPARPWAPRPTGSAGPRATAGTAVTSA